ncbi:hypothetical protein HBH53_072160 [Parastagonospora nodorum]|nr:hypothetical protein HBH53_072160 [Parastagonospora nodorum]KAH4222621.1 hypothetical protein HBI06_140350 [Parastagonospora nodorum]KAH4240452.1 hypothetical protein HBI05_108400 [Parastagonospora nodorum]KAH5058095.1 hypothetical protein HBH96_101220 [Parastagonospora nodorum]
MRMSQSDGNGSIKPQTNSRLLQAPYDIQRQIFNYLLPRDVHVFMHEDILRISECVGCPEADEYYSGLEREKDVGYDVWARRLKSTWGRHWKCEETMREGKANIDMYVLLTTCKKLNFDLRDHLSRTANFIVADLGTLEVLLRSPESAMGQMFCGTHSLEIVLIISIDTFFATELQCMGETNHPHVLQEAAIREADIWVRLGLMLSRLPSLSRVKVWLDHDSEEYWWNINEPAILHPLLDLANRSGTQVTVYLPSHAFDDISILPFHIERRPRQTYHVTGPFSYGCINHKWQYPVLRGFADSVVTDEDVGLEIEAVELKMWQGGEDPIIILESLRPYRLGLLD